MKTASVDSTSGVMRNKNVKAFYPVVTAKINKNQTTQSSSWQTLCAHLRAGASVDFLLEQYEHLDAQSRDVANIYALAYRQIRNLTCFDLLKGHSGFFVAWLCEGATLEATSTLAAITARLREQGVIK